MEVYVAVITSSPGHGRTTALLAPSERGLGFPVSNRADGDDVLDVARRTLLAQTGVVLPEETWNAAQVLQVHRAAVKMLLGKASLVYVPRLDASSGTDTKNLREGVEQVPLFGDHQPNLRVSEQMDVLSDLLSVLNNHIREQAASAAVAAHYRT